MISHVPSPLRGGLGWGYARSLPLQHPPQQIDVFAQGRIDRAQLLEQGKPEAMLEKIIPGKLEKFFKENCLLEQAFIHDSGKSVAQALKEAEGKVGGPIKVAGFVRYALGEGIEKQESDFAAEVAAASGKK